MTMHLIKLAVGPDSFTELARWQAQRLKEMKRNRQKPELMHVTRHTPKRAEEILQGGCIYWVVKGRICGRQRLLAFRPLLRDGIAHCGLVLGTELVRVQPYPRRPFQGWRYLDPKDAPPDLVKTSNDEEIPEKMLRELVDLGLL